jgi:glycine betaine/proline transport system permease protein
MRLPIGKIIETIIEFLTDTISPFTKAASDILSVGINGLIDGMLFFPPWVFILIIAGLLLLITNVRVIIFTVVGLLFIWGLDLWPDMISTLGLVLVSTLISLLIGIPLGIIGGMSEKFKSLITPVLDFMQTMPAFVYLIPAIPFFGLGKVSAVFATVIFSLPPSIRLTSLGIRQIPKEVIEAADSFGSTRMQKLIKVQLPLAMPTIMTGVNQTIMLSLSMVVIAAMIGAKGLGGEVWKAIQRLDMGLGFEAGLAVVVVAMVLDRITNNIKQLQVKGEK